MVRTHPLDVRLRSRDPRNIQPRRQAHRSRVSTRSHDSSVPNRTRRLKSIRFQLLRWTQQQSILTVNNYWHRRRSHIDTGHLENLPRPQDNGQPLRQDRTCNRNRGRQHPLRRTRHSHWSRGRIGTFHIVDNPHDRSNGRFLISGLLVLPRILRWLSKSKARFLMETSHSRFALFLCFLFVAAAALLNINIVFGAFLAGIAIGTVPQDTFAKATGSIKKISLALFTPAYFAIVGLELDLIHQFDIVIFLGFLLLSSGLKIAGALGVGKLIRKSWLSSVNLAIGLNARGGPGIVLATVAFGAGLISEPFFVALILISIVTSLITGYWLRYTQSKGWPLLQEDRVPSQAEPNR